MRAGSRAGQRLFRLIPAAALAGALVVGPAPVRANHGESYAEITGAAQCSGENFSCDEGQFTHASVDGAHDFSATDEKSVSGEVTKGTMTFTETYDPNGSLRSIVVSGQIEARNRNGGSSITDASFDTYLPAPGEFTVTGGISATLSGTELILSSVGVDIEVDCDDAEPYTLEVEAHAGASYANTALRDVPIDKTIDAPADCDVQLYAYVSSNTNRKADGQSGSASADFVLTIERTGAPGECDGVHGVVTDGEEFEGHAFPLRGIRVQLLREGAPVGTPVATGHDGSYCIPIVQGSVEPGDYKLRASLIDAVHQPPLFSTHYRGTVEPAFSELNIGELDFGPDTTVDISFGAEAAQPWLGDVANIHYQTERFVRWVTDTLQIPVQVLGTVKVVTFNNTQTYSFYDHATNPPSVVIKDANDPSASSYAGRDGPLDNGPDNAEWHEYAHHVGAMLKIGSIFSPACADRAAHAGWANASTCDSVAEGFAMFLPTLASLDIQSGEGPGFGTPAYAGMFNLEANDYRAWSTVPGQTSIIYREDFAVAQLLWDLADAAADDWGFDVELPGEEFTLSARDRVAIGGVALVQLLAAGDPSTVDEMFTLLQGNAQIPVDMRTVSVEIDDDEEPDVSPIGEIFLAHGFHPVRDESDPRFALDDAIARTDHLPAGDGFVERHNVLEVPGSGILLRNPGTTPLTVSIDVAYPGTSDHFEMTVEPQGESAVHLELPPYWKHVMRADEALPDCPEQGDALATITISAPGLDPQTIDSCEYFQLIAAASGPTALDYGGSGTVASPSIGPGGPSEPGPVAADGLPTIILIVMLGVAVVVAIVVLLQRRKRIPGAG